MDYYVLSQIVNGLIFGLIYALIALGLTVVFSIMRVVNFSHGEFYMLCLLYTSPSPRDLSTSRMPSSA